MTAASETPLRCRLVEALGRSESCPGARCPFWEPGGAVLPGRCAVGEIDLGGRAEFASWLLSIRDELEAARAPHDHRRVWRELRRRLHPDDE